MQQDQYQNYEQGRAMEELSVFVMSTLKVLQKIAYEDSQFLASPDEDDDFASAILAAQKMKEHFSAGDYSDAHLLEMWRTPEVENDMTFV